MTIDDSPMESKDMPSGFQLQAMEEQRLEHQREASGMLQAMASSNESHMADLAAHKDREASEKVAQLEQLKNAQLSYVHQEAEKVIAEGQQRAAEAERYINEVARQLQEMHLHASQVSSHASAQSMESQSAKQAQALVAAENEKLQKQMAEMQKMMMAQAEGEMNSIAIQSSTNQKRLVESMQKQTEMLKEQIAQEKMRAERERVEAAAKAEQNRRMLFTEMAATVKQLLQS